MHIDHEVVEYVATEEQDFEEVIEEYERKSLYRRSSRSRPRLTPLTLRLPKASPGA
jgi:hypothetical protein